MENQSQIVEEKNQGVVLKDWIYMCLNRWYWFLISVIVMLAGATFYILKTAPVYQRTAKILVKADKKGSSAIDVSEQDGNRQTSEPRCELYERWPFPPDDPL